MIYLRDLQLEDLPTYEWALQPSRDYHQLNGPYYQKASEAEVSGVVDKLRKNLERSLPGFTDEKRLISCAETRRIIGEVSCYWRSKETQWLEIGIVIFSRSDWGKGYGRLALPLWIDWVFSHKPELARIGLTTWSGNAAMIKLAHRIGLKQEACYRKARIVNGEYYDSVSYGILKEEWRALRPA